MLTDLKSEHFNGLVLFPEMSATLVRLDGGICGSELVIQQIFYIFWSGILMIRWHVERPIDTYLKRNCFAVARVME